MNMADIVIIGSSHVKKLGQYVSANSERKNFGVQEASTICFGISGGRLDNSVHIDKLQAKIRCNRPKYITVQLCGNDLDEKGMNEQEVETIVLRYVNLLQMFGVRYNAKIVACQLMFRERTRNVPVDQYNKLYANRLLKAEFAGALNVKYWNLAGLKQSEENIYSDGVYLNWEVGLPKYYKNIRGAIIYALRHL